MKSSARSACHKNSLKQQNTHTQLTALTALAQLDRTHSPARSQSHPPPAQPARVVRE